MTDAVLTLNAGSSSLKFSLFEVAGASLARVASGQVSGLDDVPHIVASARGRQALDRRWPKGEAPRYETLVDEVLAWAESCLGGDALRAVGHRIVHGGADFARPTAINGDVLAKLEALAPMAPLHQPHNLAGVRAAAAARPDVLQVACFDTSFHHGHAPVVDRFGLPREWEARGVRRYGFHGLSYEYVAGRMRTLAPATAVGRMIVAHLGAGASLCAMRDGGSIDTTMGFTALDGLVMSTRCGSLDPGVVIHLQRQGLSVEAVEAVLYERSGLLGVSGLSGDMRTLLASPEPAAREAVELYVFRIVREIGALTASLGGLDGLVFTAGVGAGSPIIRERVCARLGWLGVKLDVLANESGGGRISPPDCLPSVWAMPTDEEQVIADHAWRLARGRCA